MNIYTAGDRTPFTYVITHIPSGKRYYGCRYKKGCSPTDLWTTYFTSSKYVRKLIETDTISAFKTEVRKVFQSTNECVSWEYRVLHKLNAKDNLHWLNEHNGGKEFSNTVLASTETKEKMSRERLGKPKSDSMKLNAMWYYELRFESGEIEYIKGKVNVLKRLNRKDWGTIINCIKCNNGFVPRAKVYIKRMSKSFSPS
jgi:hypothetical protein